MEKKKNSDRSAQSPQPEENFFDFERNVKHEASVDYMLILTHKTGNSGGMPVPVKEETDPEPVVANIKQEDSVDYFLIIPNEKVTGMPVPLKIKNEFNLRECSVNIEKIKNLSRYRLLGPIGLRCRFCDEANYFDTEKNLKAHQKQKHFACNLCKAVFKHPNTFELHERSHKKLKGKKIFQCHYCFKIFGEKGNLTQHISIHIRAMKKPCPICKKLFVKSRLRQHLAMTHKAKKIYQCDMCPMKVKTKVNLEHHMYSHKKPFECKICKKRFSELRYFNEHKMTHKDPHPFKCTKCPGAYTRFTSLHRHMQTAHSESRNFPCKQCKYRGKTQDDLTTHIKSHTKAYQCDVCSRKFSRSSMLKEHRVLHDNPNAYQCKTCKQRFTQKKILKEHTKRKHANSSSSE